jgi:hypothetical protein
MSEADGHDGVLHIAWDRYIGESLLAVATASHVIFEDDDAWLRLEVGEGDWLELYFPAPGRVIDPAWLALAHDFLRHLADLDNTVQRACADECRRTGLHPRNYEGALAWVTLEPDAAVMHYWGTGVNTEWDERFARIDGTWTHVGK